MPINSFEDYPMTWKPSLINIKGPLYKALAEMLEADIYSGILQPGDLLPPQRELADYLDVNLSTISKAFKLCSQKGLISASVGKGTYVSTDVHINATLLDPKETKGLIELGAIHPSYEQNHYIAQAIKKLLENDPTLSCLKYTTPSGNLQIKKCGVSWLKRTHLEVNSEHILVSNGAQNALCAILSSLFAPGDRIGTDPVIFAGIKTLAKMLGIQLVPIPFENNEMSPSELIQYCKTENLNGIYVIPDFQNPTTHTMSLATRTAIADIARDYQLIIIEDAINSLYSPTILPPIASLLPEQTIYISSLSKAINPALRLAFIYSPSAYYEVLDHALYNINLMASPLNTGICCHLLNSPVVDTIISERQTAIVRCNQIADELLGSFTLFGNCYAPFRLLCLPEGWTGKNFETAAKKAGVQVYCIERFAIGNTKAIPAVRLALSAPTSETELTYGLSILRELLLPQADDFTVF